jgi:hypothetical protein
MGFILLDSSGDEKHGKDHTQFQKVSSQKAKPFMPQQVEARYCQTQSCPSRPSHHPLSFDPVLHNSLSPCTPLSVSLQQLQVFTFGFHQYKHQLT